MIATLNTTFWYLQHGQFLYKMLKMNGRMTHCTYPCAPLLSLSFFFSLPLFLLILVENIIYHIKILLLDNNEPV